MKIPEIREELLRIAAMIQVNHSAVMAERIRDLVKEMHRRPYVRKAVPRCKRPNEGAVQAYADAHPDADYMTIATHFDTNTGRVSEALAGYRD